MAGNGYSGRLRYLLASGSPVVYYMGSWRGRMHEYFFSRMEPWVHYVPAWHPEHVVQVVRYLLDNPDVAEEIGRRGQAFVERFLTPDAVSCYFHYTWRALARKSSGVVTRMDGSMTVAAEWGVVREQYFRLTDLAQRAAAGQPTDDLVILPEYDYVPLSSPA